MKLSAQNENPRQGRILALDLGEKRIGVAISDKARLFASALTVIKRTSRLADFEKIGHLVDEKGVNLIVVGLPTLSNGAEGTKASWVRDYAADLSQQINVEIRLWDESYSTKDAEASLRARGVHGKKRRGRVDEVAAAFILQSYLDQLQKEVAG